MQADLFSELLDLLDNEQLLRLVRRAGKRGQLTMAQILDEEFSKRDHEERDKAVR